MVTVKPGRVPGPTTGRLQAPHIDVTLFARGMLHRVVTRIYFADEADANAQTRSSRAFPPPVAILCSRSRRKTATASTSTSRAPAKPSSLTSDLFAGTYARGGAAEAVTGRAWVRAMVDVEAALAAACVVEGLIPPQAGEAILRALQQGPFDVEAIAAEAGDMRLR